MANPKKPASKNSSARTSAKGVANEKRQAHEPGRHRAGKCALSVNLNKVALLRNSRELNTPNVLTAAKAVLLAGADGITVHPRPDGRHIRMNDVLELADLLADFRKQHSAGNANSYFAPIEYNIEGNPFHNLLDIVRAVKPDQATFVPDALEQSTSDHGWNLREHADDLRQAIAEAHRAGARVSLFMDPDPKEMKLARELGADRIELYTEPYARSFGTRSEKAMLARYADAARAAADAGLEVNAGHDLNRANLQKFLTHVPQTVEVSIGHALIADALELGYAATIAEYQRCIRDAS